MQKQQRYLWILILGALALRLIVAMTYLRPTHPDELYQGIELAHLLRTGESRYVLEILYHLRNLTLAFIFRGVHEILDLLQISTPYTRIVGPRLLVGACDMVILWAAYQKLKADGLVTYKQAMLVLGVLGFTYFILRDAPSTTLEHTSALFMWLAVGLLTHPRRSWSLVAGGIALAMICVIRYPSALFTVGVLSAFTLNCYKGTMRWRHFALVWCGIGVGAFIGGLADWSIYGRPYESAWMYLQFNVFSGLGAELFGRSSALLYANIFVSRFGNLMTVTSLMLLPFAIVRFYKELKRQEPAAWGCLFYMAGHLIPAHKEVRFMIPMCAFVLWYMAAGLLDTFQSKPAWRAWVCEHRRSIIMAAVIFAVLPNIGHTFIILRGDFARHRMTYLNIASAPWPEDVCAVVSGISLPAHMFASSTKVTGIQQLKRESIFTEKHLHEVLWHREPISCRGSGRSIYLVHENIDREFVRERCEAVEGISLYLRIVKLVSKNNPVWKCKLKEDELARWRPLRMAHRFPVLTTLPPLGLGPKEFELFVRDAAGEVLPEEHLPR